MKRFTLIVALVLMVAMPTFAERVTSETARKVASTFLNNNGAKSAQLTDLSLEAGFSNLFIFSSEDGFVVMAADDCVQPILGYSLTGKFDAKDMPENLKWWLQGYSDEIQSAIANKTRATSETTKMWKDLAEGKGDVAKATCVVNPLIQTKWNQNKYYNNLCPAVSDGINGHAYTGCIATAMAQIMKYWNYPSNGIGSHSYTWNGQTLSANFGETTYDWNNMADYYEYYYINGTDQYAQSLPVPSEVEIAAVATLMYHCGVSVEMIYGGNSTGGSAASTVDAAYALKTYFNYKNTTHYELKAYNSTVYYTDSQWIAMLKAELDANRPVQYGGQDPNSNSGHAFVCDGYNSNDYFHFNWGWAGRYNGYFSINNLDTGANSGEAGAGNGVYTRNQEAIFGIEPGSMLPAPTNLTYTLSGLNDITLTWDSANGASSYNVYRDGNLIGNTDYTTYSETVPFGTHSYYVRCVDANSQLSLPSNTVTVTIAYQTPIVTDLTATLSGNNANLTWTAPTWCYPETPLATLTYGSGTPSGYVGTGSTGNDFYWGHRYLASDLTQYNGKVVYKISFYVNDPGAYECFVFKGTGQYSTYYYPTQEIAHLSTTASSTGWLDIDLNQVIEIDGSQDLWVFVYDPVGRQYPATYSSFSGHVNGSYSSGHYPNTDISGYLLSTNSSRAWLIKTYVTDGAYSYNIYDGTTTVASNISNTTYTVNNITNNTAHRYTLKTNFNGGLTEASNMAGLTLGTASLASLTMAANDKMTVTENSTLTVSGTLSNDNTEHLILENGAQLIHNSQGVKATVKKNIAPYTADYNGWYFIASPITEDVTPSAANGLLNGTYDLYYYDEPTYYWMSHKANAFDLAFKQGYLYANSANTTLQFAGTLTPSNSSVNIDGLSYSSTILKGFNLVGNPFACNATIDQDFYIIDNNQGIVILAEQNPIIAPCEGVFVKATASDNSVTFTKSTDTKVTRANCLDLVIGQNHDKDGVSSSLMSSILDRARVRFGEGTGMEKFSLDDKHSQISLLQNDQDFAVAYANGESEMPLSFKAAKNGTYTLSIEAEELELNYLHLIDNLTGNDIDLLATPSYTFEAKTSDYASRFKLVFDNNNGSSTGSEAFAFISGGNLIVNNEGEAQLQIVDVLGRILYDENIQGSAEMSLDLGTGTYILRLMNADKVNTQKIVVE